MQSKKKLPVWITSVALGVSVIALPTATPLFAQAASEPQKVDRKDVPEAIRKEFRSQVKDAKELAFFRWPQADGRVLYVVKGDAGEKGEKKMMIFGQDGSVLQGVTAAKANDKLVAPSATATPGGTLRPGAATTEMSALQQQIATYRQLVEAERAESENEAQRAKDVAARQQTGALSGTALDELERQGAAREKQALARYQESIRQSDDFRSRAAAATTAQAREQYAELQRLAEVRARVNTDTARFATETQRALDQVEMAGGDGATDSPAGTTRKRVGLNDLPPRVRETFGTQTDGATGATYFATTANGRTTYTANYTRSGTQYFVRAGSDGQITRGPVPINDDTRLASGRQPESDGAGTAADMNDAEAGKGAGTSLETLPATVRKAFQSKMNERAQRLATFFKHEKNGKVTYHAIWHPEGDRSKNYHLFVDSSGKVTREFANANPYYTKESSKKAE